MSERNSGQSPEIDLSQSPREWQIEKNTNEDHFIIRGPDTIGVVGQLTRVRVVPLEDFREVCKERDEARADAEHWKGQHDFVCANSDFPRICQSYEERLASLEQQLSLAQAAARPLVNEALKAERERVARLRAALERIATFNGSCTGQMARQALKEGE